MANPSMRISMKLAFILTLLAIVFGVLMAFVWFSVPKDIIREGITIEEAQGLISFPICLPPYIPSGVDTNPQIVYEADAANVPEETYIRLRYKDLDSHETVFEVYQRYTSTSRMQLEYPDPESVSRGANIIMVWWVSSPDRLTESETNEAVERTVFGAQAYESEHIVWWLYEITDPREYRSTMTRWITNHVEYRILSYLSANEIQKITLSMFGCSSSQ